MKETIICAAIYFDDGKKWQHQPTNIENGFVVCGRRHHNCYMTLSITNKQDEERWWVKLFEIQGFVTNTNRFVDRKEGYKIAFESGQLQERIDICFKGTQLEGVDEHILTSEDLY